MNLRAKTVFAVYLMIVLLMVGLFVLLRLRTIAEYERLEAEEARQGVDEVVGGWRARQEALYHSVVDATHMATYVGGVDGAALDVPAFVSTLSRSEALDLVAIVDADGALVAANARSMAGGASLPAAFAKALRELNLFADGTPRSGIVVVAGRPLNAAMAPMVIPGGERGWLVAAQHIGEDSSSASGTSLRVMALDPATDAAAAGEAIEVTVLSDDVVRTTATLRDIAGQPGVRLVVDRGRPFRAQATQSVRYSLAALAVTGMVIAIAIVVSLERHVIRRLRRMQASLGQIRETNDLNLRLSGEDPDEIGGLVDSINDMLGALADSRDHLQRSEERYRRMIETAQEAIWVIGLDGNSRLANKRLLALLGIDAAELRDAPVSRWVAASSMPAMQQLVASTESPIVPVDLQLMRPDGGVIWTIAAASRVADSDADSTQEDAVLVMLTDITERKRQEAQLEAQAELLNRTRDAIIVTDTDGRILTWNQGATLLYGPSAEAATGTLLESLVSIVGSTTWETIRTAAVTGADWIGELRHPGDTPDAARTVLCRCTRVADWMEHPVALLITCTDLTEQKRLEQHMLRSQRLESIGTLAGGLAHDLNNTLAPILSTVWLLRRKRPDTFPERAIDTIERSAQRGVDIVKQVLSFARGVDSRRTTLQPSGILNDLQSMVEKTAGHKVAVRFHIPTDLWMVVADATQLHQAVLNLCMNARDAMTDGGTLTVVAANRMLDEATAAKYVDAKPGPYLRITVSDTGDGIPADVMDRIFDPFFTTKDVGKGTGMGLSIVLSILKSHHGFLTIDSVVDEGTVVRMFIPASPNAQETMPASEHESVELRPGQGQTVLVIDDEADIRDTTRELLEFHGYTVLMAENGADAIALYGKERDRIAIVITDMNMPVMDGPQAISAIHKINPRVKIIAISGAMDPETALAGQEDSVVAFLRRPYEPIALLALLSRHLT